MSDLPGLLSPVELAIKVVERNIGDQAVHLPSKAVDWATAVIAVRADCLR
jgi:hypothetical protein